MVTRLAALFLATGVTALAWASGIGAQERAAANPAVDALVKRAAAAGVKQREITRAIFEARFVPAWEEFRDVAMSLGNGWADRATEWNRLFGSLEEIDSVRTLYGGQWIQLTGKDLMYHVFMETGGGFMLWDSLKVDPTIHRTIAEAEAYLGEERKGAMTVVDKWLARHDPDPVSLWIYFNPHNRSRFGDRQPQYETLRRVFLRTLPAPKATPTTRGLSANSSGNRNLPARGTLAPLDRPSLPFVGNKSRTGRPNMTVCADGKYDKAFAIVRTYGTLEAWTKNNWIAEGFALLTPGDCIDLHFGENQAASVGYLAVLQGILGVWETPTYRERPSTRQNADGAFGPVEKWICWPTGPAAARNVNPEAAACDDPSRRVRFNISYGTDGLNSSLTLYLVDDGFESSRTRRVQ